MLPVVRTDWILELASVGDLGASEVLAAELEPAEILSHDPPVADSISIEYGHGVPPERAGGHAAERVD